MPTLAGMDAPAPLVMTDVGLYCPEGDFHIDPWRPVPKAVITHAHADHATRGSGRYVTSNEGRHVLQVRMGASAVIDPLEWGEPLQVNGARVSIHPAGHILGSGQVRVEVKGRVVVVSGDYKTEADSTCTPFEPVKCHAFLSESTFGLPIYRWPPQSEVFEGVNAWWRANRDEGKASLLFGYALGKAQRLLAGLDPSIGPIVAHGAVEPLNRAYRATGIPIPDTPYAGSFPKGTDWAGALVIAPPSAQGTPWVRRFGRASGAFASGWMMIRGARRRRSVDRGFVLSDHVDWPSLLSAIAATEAQEVWVTHGYTSVVVKYLRELGLDARTLTTRYVGERDDNAVDDVDVEPEPEPEPEPDAEEAAR